MRKPSLETQNDYDDCHLNCGDYGADDYDYEDDDIDDGGGEDEPQHYQHNRHSSDHSIPDNFSSIFIFLN